MAVAHDASSESDSVGVGSTLAASFTWNHTPGGTPKGAMICVTTLADADYIDSVTYDGVAITQISEAADTAGEPMRATLFYIGSSVPTTSPAAVVVNRTNNATIMYACCATVTAGADTEVYVAGIVKLEGDVTVTEQSVDDGSTGVNSVRYAYMVNALNSVQGAGASSTLLQTIDHGIFNTGFCRETTAGQGARNVGMGTASPDDTAEILFAVREVVAAAGTILLHPGMSGGIRDMTGRMSA